MREVLPYKKGDVFCAYCLLHVTSTLYQVGRDVSRGRADESQVGFCPLHKILTGPLERQLRRQTGELIFPIL